MSNTTIDVALSPALIDELTAGGSGNGVYAEAVYFDNASPSDPVPATAPATNPVVFVNDGTVDTSVVTGDSLQIVLPDNETSGKLYFVIQSVSAGTLPSDTILQQITTQADISWATATTDDFSYDSFEYNLVGGAAPKAGADDVGNLTAEAGYGLPISVSVTYGTVDNPGTTATLGYNVTGQTLTDELAAINPSGSIDYDYTQGALQGDFREAVAPSIEAANGFPDPPYTNSQWDTYVESLEGSQAQNIILSGVFVGTTDAAGLYHNAGFYAYQLSWDSTDSAFWLDPIDNSQIQGDIEITAQSLEDMIYSTEYSTVGIYTGMPTMLDPNPTPYVGYENVSYAAMNAGADNQWGAILTQLITGFSAGYYGNNGVSPNPQLQGTTIDLDQSINWSPIYAFGNDLVQGETPAFYDPYSQVFFNDSNSYGSNYSDNLEKQYAQGGPQISLYDSTTEQDVSTIDLTISAPSDAPQGYTPKVLNDYIAPPDGTYAIPDTDTPTTNVVLYFSTQGDTTAGVTLDETASVTLKILTSDNGDTPTWASVVLDGSTSPTYGLWQIWTITNTGGVYSATASGIAKPAGTLLIDGFPTATSGVSWYQIVAGEKTYNFYATTDSGLFVNPDYTAGAQAIDGGGTITVGAGTNDISSLTLNLNTGSGISVDPSLLVLNTDQTTIAGDTPPDAPVAGTLSDDAFTAFSGQTMQNTNTITVSQSAIAFAWTGENDDPNTVSWVGGYTNKLTALDVALVTIHPTSGADITTTGTADIDGNWQTPVVNLPNGTYVVTMQEFAPTDTDFTTPLSPTSDELDLTVTCFAVGTLIATTAGEVPVENLAVGDHVITSRGDAKPIVWIGRRRVDCARHSKPQTVWPVRVSAHAFGPRLPWRDLWLSPDHSIHVNGALIPVRYLLNDTSVVQVPLPGIHYYHIELERHDILLSNGLPTESYLDVGDRGNFSNGRDATRLFPGFAVPSAAVEPSLIWESLGYALVVTTGDELAAARTLLDQRACRPHEIPPAWAESGMHA